MSMETQAKMKMNFGISLLGAPLKAEVHFQQLWLFLLALAQPDMLVFVIQAATAAVLSFYHL